MSPRAMALDLVLEWQKSGRLADDLVNASLQPSGLEPADRALVRELFYGWLRHRLVLGHVLDPMIKRAPRREIRLILELGVFQILYLDRIPPHAVVNEAVVLAKQRATTAEGNFVNAILRQVSREPAMVAGQLQELRVNQPWVYYSHPRWLWERWEKQWGRETVIKLAEWNNRPPAVYARLNTLKTTTGAHQSDNTPPLPFCEAATEPETGERLHPLCYRVQDTTGLLASTAWQEGMLYLQDPSTLLAVDVLDPQPGESVLDMCAAPGGKTTYLAQKMQNQGKIIAADSSNQRLGRVAENCRRLGVDIVATLPCEGTRLERCLRGSQFDRVLVDAPCSNTGVMRRRADLRWRLQEAEIHRLAALQRRLLAVAASLVKPGGRLLYSTCSLESEENDTVVQAFLAEHTEFQQETTRTLFPPQAEVDGAFVALLARSS